MQSEAVKLNTPSDALAELEDLDILSEKPVKIGKLDGNIIGVYPASLARYKDVARMIYENESDVVELRMKLLNANTTTMSQEEIDDLSDQAMKQVMKDIDKLAPMIVKMTEKPKEGYAWGDSPLSEADVKTRISGVVICQIIDAFIRTSAVPASLKKVNSLGR
jgi:hypothetical protein